MTFNFFLYNIKEEKETSNVLWLNSELLRGKYIYNIRTVFYNLCIQYGNYSLSKTIFLGVNYGVKICFNHKMTVKP